MLCFKFFICVEGVNHIVLQMGSHDLCRFGKIIFLDEVEDLVVAAVDIFHMNGIVVIIHCGKNIDFGAEFLRGIIQIVILRMTVKDKMKLVGIVCPAVYIAVFQQFISGSTFFFRSYSSGTCEKEFLQKVIARASNSLMH